MTFERRRNMGYPVIFAILIFYLLTGFILYCIYKDNYLPQAIHGAVALPLLLAVLKINKDKSDKIPKEGYLFILFKPVIISLSVITYFLMKLPNPFKAGSSVSDIYYVLCLCILAPINEEILFRGLLMDRQLEDQNRIKAIALNAIFFGLLHFQGISIFSHLMYAAVLAYVYYQFRSLKLNIMVHSAFNITSYATEYFADIRNQKIFIGVVFLLLLAAGTYIFYEKRYKNRKLPDKA